MRRAPPRILVVAPNWIGDALMAQPLLMRLREKIGHARIEVLAPEWVAPVVRRMPEVDEVIAAPARHGALELRQRWRLGRTLRKRDYSHSIVLPNSWKSALVPFFADVPLRSGYVGESRYGLLNLTYRRRPGREPMTAHYARLSEPPGNDPPDSLPKPHLALDAGAARQTADRLGFASPPLRNAVFAPGAEYGPAKRWPSEYFGRLAQGLAGAGYAVHLLGSESDAGTCDAVARASGATARNLAGRTTLDEAIDILGCADLVVSNDSGLMHVAAALGRPQIALFGSSSPEHTPPLSAHARVLWLAPDCSPCFARVCPLGHFRCMNELTVERVAAEVALLGVLGAVREEQLKGVDP